MRTKSESLSPAERAVLMLKLVLQGEQDYRRGDVMTDQESDQRFRAKLEALRERG